MQNYVNIVNISIVEKNKKIENNENDNNNIIHDVDNSNYFKANIPLNVWYYSDLTAEWILMRTKHFQETKDEYNYFRVISGNKKYFYNSSKDYLLHNKDNILYDSNSITDVNNNILFEISQDRKIKVKS